MKKIFKKIIFITFLFFSTVLLGNVFSQTASNLTDNYFKYAYKENISSIKNFKNQKYSIYYDSSVNGYVLDYSIDFEGTPELSRTYYYLSVPKNLEMPHFLEYKQGGTTVTIAPSSISDLKTKWNNIVSGYNDMFLPTDGSNWTGTNENNGWGYAIFATARKNDSGLNTADIKRI